MGSQERGISYTHIHKENSPTTLYQSSVFVCDPLTQLQKERKRRGGGGD